MSVGFWFFWFLEKAFGWQDAISGSNRHFNFIIFLKCISLHSSLVAFINIRSREEKKMLMKAFTPKSSRRITIWVGMSFLNLFLSPALFIWSGALWKAEISWIIYDRFIFSWRLERKENYEALITFKHLKVTASKPEMERLNIWWCEERIISKFNARFIWQSTRV